MGQNSSSSKFSKQSSETILNPLIISAFDDLSDGKKTITYEKFIKRFGSSLAPYLWKYLKPEENVVEMNLETFSKHANSLIGMSTDIYVKLFDSVDTLLNACFEAANIIVTNDDKQFLESLKSDMTKEGLSYVEIVKWKNAVCPRLCQSIQNKILEFFYKKNIKFEVVKSNILRPVEMYILINCLPTTVFFPPTNEEAECQSTQWTKLYSSHHQGTSINRFDSNVFQYKGATLCIFHMTNNEMFVIASDQEWRHSVNKFGGPNTTLFKFRPSFCQFDLQEKPIYCNFKLCSGVLGLSIGHHFSIDGEMSNVCDIEVWGCGGSDALKEQQKMKLRIKQQADRNKKVPLPGTWDENPDKTIMELAGFKFSLEKKNDRPPDD